MNAPPIALLDAAYCLRPADSDAGWRRCRAALRPLPQPPGHVYSASILNGMTARQAVLREAEAPTVVPTDDAVATLRRFFGPAVPVTQVHSACTSGAVALGLAALTVRAQGGVAIAAAHEERSLFNTSGFAALQTLSRGRPRPFTRGRDGFRLAAGVGLAVVGRSADAAVTLTGFAMTNDAHHPTGPHREGDGLRRCIEACLADAGLEPGEVACLKFNAVGTPYSDAAEYKALRAVWGAQLPRLPGYALKPALGHLQGASGLVETVVAARYLQRGLVPPVARADLDDLEFGLGLAAVPRRLDYANVLLLFSGFGGQNACLLLERRV